MLALGQNLVLGARAHARQNPSASFLARAAIEH